MKNALLPAENLKVIKIVEGDNLLGDDWMVSRKYQSGGRDIWVKGFGRTRAEAILDYKAELELEMSISDIFPKFGGKNDS